jgi:hypothetical protein
MWDIIKALIGPRMCPWCRTWHPGDAPIREWLINKVLPLWISDPMIFGWNYNSWVGRTGISIHRKHLKEGS